MAAAMTEVVIKFDSRDRRLLTRIAERLDTLIALLTKEQAEAIVITEAELRAEIKRQGHPSEA